MRRQWLIALIVFLIFIIGAGFIIYLFYTDGDSQYTLRIENPVLGLSDEDAVNAFNESFVLYLLASIGAGNLHNAPFSSAFPTLEIVVSDVHYNAVVEDGRIKVDRGDVPDEDIRIISSAGEAVKMMRDKNFIENSFRSGASQIELVAGKAELFAKGYLQIYRELTGKDAE
mgnify:CR=1 FL=1